MDELVCRLNLREEEAYIHGGKGYPAGMLAEYNTSRPTDQESLQSLLGTVQCPLMVGHNKHKDMKLVVEFLDTVGKIALPGCSRQADVNDIEQVWSALVAICYEFVGWCNVFVTEGLTYKYSRSLALDWLGHRSMPCKPPSTPYPIYCVY